MYTGAVKNITFSAEERLIERARERARLEKRTLNVAFRDWLAQYAGGPFTASELEDFWRRTEYVNAGRRFSRDELNQR